MCRGSATGSDSVAQFIASRHFRRELNHESAYELALVVARDRHVAHTDGQAAELLGNRVKIVFLLFDPVQGICGGSTATSL